MVWETACLLTALEEMQLNLESSDANFIELMPNE